MIFSQKRAHRNCFLSSGFHGSVWWFPGAFNRRYSEVSGNSHGMGRLHYTATSVEFASSRGDHDVPKPTIGVPFHVSIIYTSKYMGKSFTDSPAFPKLDEEYRRYVCLELGFYAN